VTYRLDRSRLCLNPRVEELGVGLPSAHAAGLSLSKLPLVANSR
jgi:hypothetical protein